ncbi:uncharacterized membrane protein YidH (DUF202 family) [Microbacterium sp. ZKA21]|uniref:hypothetical protein n=1 Tax=Microbacterium sp. ZKA21 TaxID=3381694 RepID=UPI003D204A0F
MSLDRSTSSGSARQGRAALIIASLVGIPVAVLLTWPQAFGAQRLPGIAQLIAFRAPLALVLLVVAIVATGAFLLFRRQAQVLACIAAGIAIAALAASAGNAGVSASVSSMPRAR